MKKIIYILVVLLFMGCDKFLDLQTFQAIPEDDAYTTVEKCEYGLIGAYNALGGYRFMGRNVQGLGDLASDNGLASTETGHFVTINQYAISSTDNVLQQIWMWGFEVIDSSTRTILVDGILLGN